MDARLVVLWAQRTRTHEVLKSDLRGKSGLIPQHRGLVCSAIWPGLLRDLAWLAPLSHNVVMERDRRRAIRALSVDKDWCGSQSAGNVGRDWCSSGEDRSVADRMGRRGWCGTDLQSPEPDDIGLLLGRLSSRRRRS